MSLENKVAIVTGGSRGIGRAVVLLLVNKGAKVVFTYSSNKDMAEKLVERILSDGGEAIATQSDASNIQAAERLTNKVLETFGTVHICVNNAGIAEDNLLMRLSEEQWNNTIATNLTGTYALCKKVVRPMMKAGGGSIINMSSIIGVRGNAGQSAYAASKAGIIGFTKSLALELGSRNIRCNCIAPGFVETDMTKSLHKNSQADKYKQKIPLKRFGHVDDIASSVAFLASDEAKYITGQVLSVCGGLNT